MYDSKILYNALKLSEEIYDESQYGVDDLYRIKDISHCLDKNHWESKKWLAENLFDLYNHDSGKILIVGGWYGLTAYILRTFWPGKQMNIVSSDMDPMCEQYGYKLFPDCDIQYKTLEVNSEIDLSGYTAIINTSCEHMEPKDIQCILDNKDKDAWVAFQTNDYYDLDSHINCSPTLQYWKEELLNVSMPSWEQDEKGVWGGGDPKLWFAYEGQQQASEFNRFMIIGK